MSLIHVPASATRASGTAAAATETLASPTVGGTTTTSLWRVRMAAGSVGPLHSIDSEQIWTVLVGRASVRNASEELIVTIGDTVIMPAQVARSVSAIENCEFLVCGSPNALAALSHSGSEPVSPPWVR